MSRTYSGGEITFDDSGLEDFEKMLQQYARQADPQNVLDAEEAGAKEFVSDLLKLPKPRSEVRKAGYTHLVNTFAMERANGEIEVGWGKYYGPMVEHGTKKMAAKAHLKPLFERNKEKYYRKMTEKILS